MAGPIIEFIWTCPACPFSPLYASDCWICLCVRCFSHSLVDGPIIEFIWTGPACPFSPLYASDCWICLCVRCFSHYLVDGRTTLEKIPSGTGRIQNIGKGTVVLRD